MPTVPWFLSTRLLARSWGSGLHYPFGYRAHKIIQLTETKIV